MVRDRTENEPIWRLELRSIGAGLVGGFFGGIAMGVLFQLGTAIMPVLGAFLGEQSSVRGWIVHLAISPFNGAGFAVVLGYPAIRDFTASFDTIEYVLSGITFVYAVAGLTIGVLPLIFELPWAVDVNDPLLSQEHGTSVVALLPAAVFAVAHLVYGAILGGVYGRIDVRDDAS